MTLLLEIDVLKVQPQPNDESPIKNISVIDANTSYPTFFYNYMHPNNPCIISNVCTNWSSFNNWVKNGAPDYEHLKNRYGDLPVTIYDCHSKYYNSQKTKECKFKEYINYWQQYTTEGYPEGMPLDYLKDWHLKRLLPNDNFYEVPEFFASDWLNEYFCAETNDDYRFVYMGPKGSWTPFHTDVFSSFSWSVNLCGRKRWYFYKIEVESDLRYGLGNFPYDISQKPEWIQFTFTQEPGDAVFVPSCWAHQVENIEDTISVNHNWINGCNIGIMWESLCKHLEAVKREITDCRDMNDWHAHCQVMLKVDFGIDFKMFYDMLRYISERRLRILEDGLTVQHFEKWELGRNHALFDLKAVSAVLKSFVKHEDVAELCFGGLDNLVKDVESVLQRNL